MTTALATSAGAEALKTWGAFAIVLMLLGAIAWSYRSALLRKQEENEALRKQQLEQMQARIEDALKMTRVAESSTQTTASRVQGDKDFLELMRRMCERMEAIEDALPAPSPRSPRQRSLR